jgi:hypothetical protein
MDRASRRDRYAGGTARNGTDVLVGVLTVPADVLDAELRANRRR